MGFGFDHKLTIIGSNQVGANTLNAAEKSSTSSENKIQKNTIEKKVTRKATKPYNPGTSPKLFFKLAAANFPKVSQYSVDKRAEKQERKEFLKSFKGVGKSPAEAAKVIVPFIKKIMLTNSDKELREELIKIRDTPEDSGRTIIGGNPQASGRTIFHPLDPVKESQDGRISRDGLTTEPTKIPQRLMENKRPHSHSSRQQGSNQKLIGSAEGQSPFGGINPFLPTGLPFNFSTDSFGDDANQA